MINKIIIILLFTLFLFSCETEISLDKVLEERNLVVEGEISNLPGIYTIKLSLSSDVNDAKYIPYENCKVVMYNNTGYSEVLTETAPGIYKTSETGIQGEIGKQYKITIETPLGKKYETDYQTMLEPIGIDSVYAEEFSREDIDYPHNLVGYDFFVNTKNANKPNNYFLWNMVETYEYVVEWDLYAIWTGQILINRVDTITELDTLNRCWKTQNIEKIYTGKTSNLSVPMIIKKPLHSVSTETNKLEIKYSLLLKQKTINEVAYNFWHEVENQMSDDNTLFTSQPFNIIGNVKNIDNPNELVYGFFTVSSISQKRIFIKANGLSFYYPKLCIPVTEHIFEHATPPLYLVMTEDGKYGSLDYSCFDCRSRGGTVEAPDFWIFK